MKILDLFCKAGGAAMGYKQAGFDEIVGVDVVSQPNYPFEFVCMDAIEFLKTQDLSSFDAIHASPPCQAHSKCRQLSEARNGGQYGDHEDFIARTRELLDEIGKPYIIENVEGSPLKNPISLYGSQFDNLYTQRRSLFESNIPLKSPERKMQRHKTPTMDRTWDYEILGTIHDNPELLEVSHATD